MELFDILLAKSLGGSGGGGGGGGSDAIFTGTFTTSSVPGETKTISIPYTGNGYPIILMIGIEDGMDVPDSAWSTSIERYSVGCYVLYKQVFSIAPDYVSTGYGKYPNKAWCAQLYKSSNSTATSYNIAQSKLDLYITTGPDTSASGCVNVSSNTSFIYLVRGNSGYGLHREMTYRYTVVYSDVLEQ